MDTKKPNVEREIIDFCLLRAMMLEAINGVDVSRHFMKATEFLQGNLSHHNPIKVMVHGTGRLEQRFERGIYVLNRGGDSYTLYDQQRSVNYYLSAIPSTVMTQSSGVISSMFALFFNQADLEEFNRLKHKLALNPSVASA